MKIYISILIALILTIDVLTYVLLDQGHKLNLHPVYAMNAIVGLLAVSQIIIHIQYRDRNPIK